MTELERYIPVGRLAGQRPRQAGQVHKHGLLHVFRLMRVALDQPERRRMDQVHEPGDQFPKGRIRTVPVVFGEQSFVVRHVESSVKTRPSAKPNKKVPGRNGK